MTTAKYRLPVTGVGLVSALTLVASAAIAGPLDPPPGPVAPTNKTLQEVQPAIVVNDVNTPGAADAVYRITEPGSYWLQEGFVGEAGKNGIVIDADNVTLYMGYQTIEGVPGSLDGVHVVGGHMGIEVSNGFVSGWGGDGVDATGSGCVKITNMAATACGANGMTAGDDARVEGSKGSSNTQNGVSLADRGRIARSEFNDNQMNGVSFATALVIEDSRASGNTISGVAGGESLLAINITTSDNGGAGIDVQQRATIRGCSADNNVAAGIAAQSQSSVIDCTVTRCGTPSVPAISVGDGAETGGLISRRSATQNEGVGIAAGDGVLVESCSSDDNQGNGFTGFKSAFVGCSASNNSFHGFLPGGYSRVSGCTATANPLDGFNVNGGNDVDDCSAFNNGQNGFFISGGATLRLCVARGQLSGRGFNISFATGATLSDCEASQNQRGIRLEAGSLQNLVIRSRAVNNTITNWENPIPANNRVAPIVTDPALAGPMDNFE